jgi:thioredoxin-dependent peroxiredoxin
MSQERQNVITFKGNPFTLIGPELMIGQPVPAFTVIANDLSEVTLNSTQGKTRIFVTVPSLDTPVCDMEGRRFNQEAAKMEGVEVIVLSMDLPFAQKRWCGAENIEAVKTASDYRGATFAQAYGILIKELHLHARAVFVINPKNELVYQEIVSEVTAEPNYEAALNAAKSTLAAV